MTPAAVPPPAYPPRPRCDGPTGHAPDSSAWRPSSCDRAPAHPTSAPDTDNHQTGPAAHPPPPRLRSSSPRPAPAGDSCVSATSCNITSASTAGPTPAAGSNCPAGQTDKYIATVCDSTTAATATATNIETAYSSNYPDTGGSSEEKLVFDQGADVGGSGDVQDGKQSYKTRESSYTWFYGRIKG